ncbi:hypothetical protein [Streptomyces sp. CBMA152]|uniref:hypothetical protein n=1 Tax=Streptomyces sp. CBMA152 TaxID=1896312 RepID=UPI00166158CF|nr:hypothetical protein [Streptomyces sp. CBMA152]MBD0742113.1 hypothetical protein [Streptomyces sp. CBMA152]
MDAIQQQMLDTYRAARLQEPAPPLPGQHDIRTLREARDYRRFEAVLAGHLAHGRLRAALARLLPTPRHHRTPACH